MIGQITVRLRKSPPLSWDKTARLDTVRQKGKLGRALLTADSLTCASKCVNQYLFFPMIQFFPHDTMKRIHQFHIFVNNFEIAVD